MSWYNGNYNGLTQKELGANWYNALVSNGTIKGGSGSHIDAGGYVPNFQGANKAAQTRAWIKRDEWEDYKARFLPVEQKLIARIGREGTMEELDELLKRANINSESAFNAMKKANQSNFERMGISLNADAAKAYAREMQQSRALAGVDAENRLRSHIVNRNQNMALGGAGMRSSAMGQTG